METPVTCPACRSQFVGDLTQIIDVGLEPQLKNLLLNGSLNVVQCPSCGSITRISTPLLYHDPNHELFMVHVPMEMGMPHDEEQKVIGQLVRRAMDRLPAEQRKGYMLQPQTVISMQTFMEKVLETEGITPEMLAEQRKKADLLGLLLESGREEMKQIIRDRDGEIDETFFALLEMLLSSAESSPHEEEYLKLINLRAKLFMESSYGKKLEKQQQALQLFARDAKKEGLSPKLLLRHVLTNRSDLKTVESLVLSGQQAFNYEFFVLLSEKIEKRQKSGINADDLIDIRELLLGFQQEMESRSRAALDKAQKTLRAILSAPDIAAAVRQRQNEIDELFMFVLSANLEEATRREDRGREASLRAVQEAIMNDMDRNLPPEVRLINQLVGAQNDEKRRQLLAENSDLVQPELLEVIKALKEQSENSQDRELKERLAATHSIVSAYMLTQ